MSDQALREMVFMLQERLDALVLPEAFVPPSGTGSVSATGVAGTAVTLLAAGTVTQVITLLYAVYANTGADANGGTVTLGLGDAFALYHDGTDVLTLTLTAGGALQVQRTAGADTFECNFTGVWV